MSPKKMKLSTPPAKNSVNSESITVITFGLNATLPTMLYKHIAKRNKSIGKA